MTATVVSQDRPGQGDLQRRRHPLQHRPAHRLHHLRRRQGRRRRLRQGRRRRALAETATARVLRYTAKAQVGGKLAQLGARLIDATAKQMADHFFGAFAAGVGGARCRAAAAPVMVEARTVADAPVVEHADRACRRGQRPRRSAQFARRPRRGSRRPRSADVLGGPQMWGLLALVAVIARHAFSTVRIVLAILPEPGSYGMTTVSLKVNGKAVSAEVEDRTLLVELLREKLRLTGTHVGCDTSQCGACVVHVDGKAVKSCTMLAVQADGAEVLDHRGPAPNGDAASDAGGVPRASWPAVRLLHAGHDHDRGRHGPPARQRARRADGAPRAGRQSSAAAPATTTSSRRSAAAPRRWPR